MEGVTLGLRDIYELILNANPKMKPTEIISSGGGSRSPLWRQIQADIFGLPVKTLPELQKAVLMELLLQ